MITGGYEMRTLTRERLSEVALAWEEAAGADEFASDLRHVFDWCETHIEPAPGQGQAFEMVNLKLNRTDALFEVIDGPYNRTTKLLVVTITPQLWALPLAERVGQVASLYLKVLLAMFQSGYERGYDTVKIFGRNDSLHKVLTTVANNWNENDTTFSARMDGRWLTINLNKGN